LVPALKNLLYTELLHQLKEKRAAMVLSTGNMISSGAVLLGVLGILVGRNVIKFPQKENLTEEFKKRELKKIFRAGLMMLFVGILRILDTVINPGG